MRWLNASIPSSKDFVIVASAEIEFGAGFTVLTGETGAGKSILLDALGLALGSRGDAAMVREGARRADISADFSVDAALEARLAALDLGGDAGSLLLRRIIEADGAVAGPDQRTSGNGHPAARNRRATGRHPRASTNRSR